MSPTKFAILLVPWAPFQDQSSGQNEDQNNEGSELAASKPQLYKIHTIQTSMEEFRRLVGGITLNRLFPFQRYKVRVAGKNTLGLGQFSPDKVVI